MKKLLGIYLMIFSAFQSFGQSSFEYELQLTPMTITNLPGLQSFATAQHNGKWLLIGGRKDGLHARQPFNAFAASQNNTSIYVVDVNSNSVWSSSITSLPTGIQEQLQSTNMSFYQDHDSLYLIGGYAYSATAGGFITFDKMTSVNVSGLINAIVSSTSITSFFKQISDPIFTNTGAQLGKIGNTFYLVGGQNFVGQYNPMGNPTYTQTYHSQYSKFTINNSGAQLSIANLQTITDAVHLRRRDYNLLPQIFPNGEEGYTISSGVFQQNVDLPFLYPVDITANGYQANTSFNQYLSNYHSAKVSLWDSANNKMHNLFFGGISQYTMVNGTMIQDINVPFTKTISRMTRLSDSTLSESVMNIDMPTFLGASAEFLPNHALPHTESEIIKLTPIVSDTFLIGHIVGGIQSPSANPFSVNQTSTTSANSTIYKVELIKTGNGNPESLVDGTNPYEFTIYPNPTEGDIHIQFDLKKRIPINFLLTSEDGKIISENEIEQIQQGNNLLQIPINHNNINTKTLILTLVFENKYFVTHKITLK